MLTKTVWVFSGYPMREALKVIRKENPSIVITKIKVAWTTDRRLNPQGKMKTYRVAKWKDSKRAYKVWYTERRK